MTVATKTFIFFIICLILCFIGNCIFSAIKWNPGEDFCLIGLCVNGFFSVMFGILAFLVFLNKLEFIKNEYNISALNEQFNEVCVLIDYYNPEWTVKVKQDYYERLIKEMNTYNDKLISTKNSIKFFGIKTSGIEKYQKMKYNYVENIVYWEDMTPINF